MVWLWCYMRRRCPESITKLHQPTTTERWKELWGSGTSQSNTRMQHKPLPWVKVNKSMQHLHITWFLHDLQCMTRSVVRLGQSLDTVPLLSLLLLLFFFPVFSCCLPIRLCCCFLFLVVIVYSCLYFSVQAVLDFFFFAVVVVVVVVVAFPWPVKLSKGYIVEFTRAQERCQLCLSLWMTFWCFWCNTVVVVVVVVVVQPREFCNFLLEFLLTWPWTIR